jgi:hypothetical protein
LNPGEEYIRTWRCVYKTTPDSHPVHGALLTTNMRLLFIEQQPQAFVQKYSVNLWDIHGVSTEGFLDKYLIVTGRTGPTSWRLIFDDIYDIDQSTFNMTNKVDLGWMQAHILETKNKARR